MFPKHCIVFLILKVWRVQGPSDKSKSLFSIEFVMKITHWINTDLTQYDSFALKCRIKISLPLFHCLLCTYLSLIRQEKHLTGICSGLRTTAPPKHPQPITRSHSHQDTELWNVAVIMKIINQYYFTFKTNFTSCPIWRLHHKVKDLFYLIGPIITDPKQLFTESLV